MVTFYHGTNLVCAAGLIKKGFVDLTKALRFRTYVREVWPTILDKCGGNLFDTADLFHRAGVNNFLTAPTALDCMYQERDQTTFSYGHLYVDLNLGSACRYGYRGPEILDVVRSVNSVLEMIEPKRLSKLREEYHELFRFVSIPYHPVVLIIIGAETSDLSSQRGSACDLNST